MSDQLLVLPENPPDEGDFVYVGFSKEWLEFVLGGIEAFRNNALWVDGEANDAVGQIDKLLDLLMTNLDPPP